MKALQINFFRAICSIAIGILLVMYPTDTVSWVTIAIGILFLISGAISIIAYYVAKHSTEGGGHPLFPIVGIGSAVLGIAVIIFHSSVISIMGYILGAILILGALNQIIELLFATARYGKVNIWYWVCPIVVLAIGILAIVKPEMMFSSQILILGLCLLLYGLTEVVNGIRIYTAMRKSEKLKVKSEKAEAVEIEAEEVKLIEE